MKNNMVKRVLIIFIMILIFSGCSDKTIVTGDAVEPNCNNIRLEENNESRDRVTVEDGVTKIIFPSGMDEVYDYNAAILERNSFCVSMVLPEGWSVSNVEPGDEKHIYFGLYSIYQIYDENRVKIGSVGYNIIPDDAQGETLTPMYIYNQIAIGNNYHFEIRDDYTVVKSTERTETAITRVYLSPQINGSDEESWNAGIVSYDLDEGVYIGIELVEGFEEDLSIIAESIEID